ncbi:hypothetical protein LN42_07445 [Marinitoga sp. 1137]|uniref:carboxypeptidase-like regulatory domain-containing protein n=1 Tax=Marinitoga sp. 1137 TaxID=1545835 RepID=UPI00095079B8|nr:DUF4382 domain-containing protein [Marinitoga sp. 1137]APT76235.1 hypothetical protein LN42_07445 [Marinitoga sp. 1137]
MLKKVFITTMILIIFLFSLTGCVKPKPQPSEELTKIIVYLTDAPDESISEATLKVASMKLTSDSTNIELLSNYEKNFLTLAGTLEKIKEFNINEKNLKNAKISVILSPTATIVEEDKTKNISISSTEMDITVNIDSISAGRTYNLIIDFDIGNSYNSSLEEFSPIIRAWTVADTEADYRTIEGHVYDNSDLGELATPKPGRVVLILPTDNSTVLYSTITNKDGYFKFNKIKLGPGIYNIGVAKSNATFYYENDPDLGYSYYLARYIELEPATVQINISIGDQ